jgi:hypothetical protein
MRRLGADRDADAHANTNADAYANTHTDAHAHSDIARRRE